jgi:hypothetical protein
MSILMKKDNTGYNSVILNEFGLVLNQVTYIPENERDMYDGEEEMIRQVGVRYEDLNTTIAVLSALRNANALGLEVKGLFLHRYDDVNHIVTPRGDDYVVIHRMPFLPTMDMYPNSAGYAVSSIHKDIKVEVFPPQPKGEV